MIYDCFAFFNEFELLEIRLNELNDVVDQFVLVEATRSFQKKEKPLYFAENKKRFEKFLPKITHIVVDQYPNFFTHWRIPKTWDYDDHQKDQLARGLKNCKPDDVIIISDLDEIPRKEKIQQYKHVPGVKIFRQKLFYYFLNCFVTDYDEPLTLSPDGSYKPWHGSLMMDYKDFTTVKDARLWKNQKRSDFVYIEDGGWHYSSLGGVERVIEKIESYAHKEFNTSEFKDVKRVEELMRSGKDLFDRKMKSKFVPVEQDLPHYLQSHLAQYKHLYLDV